MVPQATIFSGDPPGGKDGNPASIEFVFANDPDGDGILTPNDLCPFVANTLDQNIDSDCDGIGDPCDKCPHDPLNDADHDGVCGDVDNCPNVPNSDQANCNFDSEIATHTAVLGDA